MPVWLQVVGAIASALLSYYTSYDDTKVRDILKDIAYNLNLALQKLDEIANQIDKLGAALSELPEEIQQIVHSEALVSLNTVINGALIRYKTLLAGHHGPNDTFFVSEVINIYHDVSKARSELEAVSQGDNIQYAPLAAAMSPLAMLLELGLLFRAGRQANTLRAATTQEFLNWFKRILDPTVPNSVAAYLAQTSAALAKSDKDVAAGLFGPAVAHPGTRQAFYCLEHQIGGTLPAPIFFGGRPGESLAEWAGLTWIRFYGITTLNQGQDHGEVVWVVGLNDPKLDMEQYARKGPSDQWYGPKPAYNIPVQSYDSQDIQRFQGQDHPSRVRDIMNSSAWHDFVANQFPNAKQQLATNNQLRVNVRIAGDVIKAVRAAQHVAAGTVNQTVLSVEAA